MTRARLIDLKDGRQIVVFPPGFEVDAEKAHIERDGDRVILKPVRSRRATAKSI
jgi:hypothetical protein